METVPLCLSFIGQKNREELGSPPLTDGKPIKGVGRLTDKVADELQCYYGKAIRANTNNLENMKRAVTSFSNR
ncbi:hypothetical protein J6590_092549 [Homalodisca vitripennis]|nr:hypothetical protein J6590_092549 [Homalodisca vitripennis]